MESNNYKASTFVELILYLALFSLIILTMVQFFVFISNKNVDARNRIELSRSVIFLREHYTQTERNISSFVDASSIYGNDNGKVTVVTSGGNVSYRLVNSKLVFNSGSDIDLTPSGMIINKLRFDKRTNSSGKTIGVFVSMTVSHVNIVKYSESFDFLIQSK